MRPTLRRLSALVPAVILLTAGAAEAGPPRTIHVEAEQAAGASRVTAGRIQPLGSRQAGLPFSAGAALRWTGARPGSRLVLPIEVPEAGRYRILVRAARGPDHADVMVAVGQASVQGVPGYAPRPTLSGVAVLGTVSLARGSQSLVLTVSGRDRASRGWLVTVDGYGIDYVGPGGAAPPSPPTPKRPERPQPGPQRPAPPTLPMPQLPDDLSKRPARPGYDLAVAARSQRAPRLLVQHDGLDRALWWDETLVLSTRERVLGQGEFVITGLPAGVREVQWQVSSTPFPRPRADASSPHGLVAEGKAALTATAQGQRFRVSMEPLFRPTGAPLQLLVAPTQLVGGRAPAAAVRDHLAHLRSPVLQQGTRGARGAPRIVHLPLATALTGARTLYLRAMPLDPAVRAAPLPSNGVTLRLAPPAEGVDLNETFGEPLHPAPILRLLSYEPIRWEHPESELHWVVTEDVYVGRNLEDTARLRAGLQAMYAQLGGGLGAFLQSLVRVHDPKPLWRAGHKITMTYGDPHRDLLETIVGAVVDFVDWVARAVDWVAEAYAAIKASAVGFICSADSSGTCDTIAAMALDAALASLGVPPDLPTFDELVEMGKGELVSVITREIAAQSPIPGIVSEELVELGLEALASGIKDAATGEGRPGTRGSPWRWMRPDPEFQYRPAVVRVEIRNPATVRQSGYIGATIEGVLSARDRDVILEPGERREVVLFLTEDLWRFVPERMTQSMAFDEAERAKAWRRAFDRPGPRALQVSAEAFGADGQQHRRSSARGRAPVSMRDPHTWAHKIVILPGK
ncbi:MAG: hypothetical protein KDB73_09520 [Planctomycetes bacterium]|nr:hypothetical protein [Planctomycetota bacterium]